MVLSVGELVDCEPVVVVVVLEVDDGGRYSGHGAVRLPDGSGECPGEGVEFLEDIGDLFQEHQGEDDVRVLGSVNVASEGACHAAEF